MKEPYSEDPASHTGLESCVVVREDIGEVLTEVCAGPVLSLENFTFGVPTLFSYAEGHALGVVIGEMSRDSAWSKTWRMCRITSRENREISDPPESKAPRAALGSPRT